jgi:hypothetical protein
MKPRGNTGVDNYRRTVRQKLLRDREVDARARAGLEQGESQDVRLIAATRPEPSQSNDEAPSFEAALARSSMKRPAAVRQARQIGRDGLPLIRAQGGGHLPHHRVMTLGARVMSEARQDELRRTSRQGRCFERSVAFQLFAMASDASRRTVAISVVRDLRPIRTHDCYRWAQRHKTPDQHR